MSQKNLLRMSFFLSVWSLSSCIWHILENISGKLHSQRIVEQTYIDLYIIRNNHLRPAERGGDWPHKKHDDCLPWKKNEWKEIHVFKSLQQIWCLRSGTELAKESLWQKPCTSWQKINGQSVVQSNEVKEVGKVFSHKHHIWLIRTYFCVRTYTFSSQITKLIVYPRSDNL